MARIEGQIVINRPVEVVFDFVADERNEPRFNPQMRRVEQISAGPIGLGTEFRAETLSMGRTVEMVIEFTTFERPRQLASTALPSPRSGAPSRRGAAKSADAAAPASPPT